MLQAAGDELVAVAQTESDDGESTARFGVLLSDAECKPWPCLNPSQVQIVKEQHRVDVPSSLLKPPAKSFC